MSTVPRHSSIVVEAGASRCALPIAHVVEIMRPLPMEPFVGAPGFVRGLAKIRGLPVPVVDLGLILGKPSTGEGQRFVVVRAGERSVALLVDAVLGVRTHAKDELATLPPLLGAAEPALVSTIAALDERLLLVLGAAALVSLVPHGAP